MLNARARIFHGFGFQRLRYSIYDYVQSTVSDPMDSQLPSQAVGGGGDLLNFFGLNHEEPSTPFTGVGTIGLIGGGGHRAAVSS